MHADQHQDGTLQQQLAPDEQEEEDMDQQPEQYNGAISSALADQRVSRKRAQEDVKLLANRIALLKQEEKKVKWRLDDRVSGVGVEKDRRYQEEGRRHHARPPTECRAHD